MSQFIKFYFTSSMLSTFWTLIRPSSGACDFSEAESQVVLQPATWIPPQPATPKLQHTSQKEHTTNVVIQQKSRRILMMDVLMSETC